MQHTVEHKSKKTANGYSNWMQALGSNPLESIVSQTASSPDLST